MSSSRRVTTFAPTAATSAPGSSHSPRRTGSRELVIVTTTSFSAASRWLSPGSAPVCSQNAASLSGVRQYATTRSSRRDGSADARDLRLRLVAAADDPERARPARREVARRDPARRPGPELPEAIGLDHGDERRRVGVEEADDERRTVRRRGVELPTGEPELAVGSRHVGERALGQAQPAPRGDLDVARRHPPKARLDGIDRGGRREQSCDVGLGQVQGHGAEV